MNSKEKNHIKNSMQVGISGKYIILSGLWKNLEKIGTKCKNNSYLCDNRVKIV